MTLAEIIARRIASDGPISVADYMSECLMHPDFGYYKTRDPFGVSGDFTTAPEVSQMFGEVIGLCLAQYWLDQGQPPSFTLLELGPGRGTLMADMLRATARVPGFHQAARILLYEASPVLRARQAATLQAYDVGFIDDLSDLPDQPLFCVANEFFDALPIRQFIRDGAGWRERRIGCEQERLAFGLGPPVAPSDLDHRIEDTKDGDLVEIMPAAASIMAALGSVIARAGGMGLIIDYGDWRSLGDTLQALRRHERAGILEAPGDCDLTAHVDFEALARAAPCAHSRLAPQGVFLERLGISARAKALAAGLRAEALESHIAAHRRLTHPAEMGNLFKVMGLFRAGCGVPPGLDT